MMVVLIVLAVVHGWRLLGRLPVMRLPSIHVPCLVGPWWLLLLLLCLWRCRPIVPLRMGGWAGLHGMCRPAVASIVTRTLWSMAFTLLGISLLLTSTWLAH